MRTPSRVYLYTVLAALKDYEERVRPGISESHVVLLPGMPIPPSLNNAYANATGKGRVLTTDALRWQYECNEWAMDNIPALCAVRDLAGYSRPMTLEADFHFPRSAVYTKAGEPKALDPPNFGKLLIDHIAVYAQVNDTIFFRTVFDKHVAASGASERRWVDVRVMLRDSVT